MQTDHPQLPSFFLIFSPSEGYTNILFFISRSVFYSIHQKLSFPERLAHHFNAMSLKFRVGHFSIGFEVKSYLILAIDLLFKEHGIEIPFPHQDVHIRSAKGIPEKKS